MPAAIRGDEESIRARLDLACCRALELEGPEDAIEQPGLIEGALLPRRPGYGSFFFPAGST